MRGTRLGHLYKLVNGNTQGGSHDIKDVLVNNEYYPASGSYIDVSDCERVHVLIQLGELADNITFELYESDSASGTEDQISATYYKVTTTGGSDDTDEGVYACITIEVSRLSTDHHYLTTKVGGVTGSNYAAITYFLETGNLPETGGDLDTSLVGYYSG